MCGLITTAYLFGIIMPFFGPPLSTFGMLGIFLIFIGSVIGGVFGVLLHKTTAGITLGIEIALIFSIVIKYVFVFFYIKAYD